MSRVPRSDVMAANIRGLAEPTEPTPGKFCYTNCLGEIDNTEEKVKSVQFDLSRYGSVKKIIKFPTPVTYQEAILAAEEYLSQPLTKEYYEIIKEDTFHEHEWEEAKKWFKCRGDCLTDAKFLERADLTKYIDELVLWCGS